MHDTLSYNAVISITVNTIGILAVLQDFNLSFLAPVSLHSKFLCHFPETDMPEN